MINRSTGEIDFRSGLHFSPHCSLSGLTANSLKLETQKLSLHGWKRHIFGSHDSEYGIFEVEALSADDDRIHVVMLAHQHAFYQPTTAEDAERRAFHEGVISSDLGGQREFPGVK